MEKACGRDIVKSDLPVNSQSKGSAIDLRRNFHSVLKSQKSSDVSDSSSKKEETVKKSQNLRRKFMDMFSEQCVSFLS